MTLTVARGSGRQTDTQALWLLRFAFLLAALVAAAWTTADPDLWGHVKYGGDIVRNGALESRDPYSFTSDRSWVNHEWLAEVAMYGAYAAGGPVGLVALKVLVLAAVLGCIMLQLRQFRWSPISHDLLILIALVGMLPRYHPVRPQLFSLLLFAALLLTLTMAERRSRRLLLAVPFVFGLWANLHGGFLVGLGVLALWLGVRLLQNPRDWVSVVVTGASAVLATLLTPYGIALWRFLGETVGVNRPLIHDWQPLWEVGPLTIIGWSLVAITAGAALYRSRFQTDVAAFAIVVLLAFASLRVSRIDAFFTLAVVMLLGPAYAAGARARAMAAVSLRPWARAAAATIAAAAVYAFQQRASCIELDSLYPEPESTEFLRPYQGRMLTYFNWGQYAIWHLSPRLQVSMDGRRETVYSDEVVDAHLRFYANAPDAMSIVDRLQPDLIWLPAHLAVTNTLAGRDWHQIFRGPQSVVFAPRATLDAPNVVAAPARRCFPDA